MKILRIILFACFCFLGCVGDTSSAPTPELEFASAALQTCPTPAQLVTDLGAAVQSDVISLSGTNPINCPEVSMTGTWSGGKLVFSDSPESPSVKAKLYDDATLPATSGAVYNRAFVYHVNGKSSGYMRFTVLLKNLDTSAATLTVQAKGTAGPTTSYLYAGKLGFSRWLTSTAAAGVSVAPGATVRLDSTYDTTNVAPSYLLHGIWDYSFPAAHELIVCALDSTDDPITVCPGLAVAARDTHQRGTFPNADKIYDTASGVGIDTATGIQQFPLGGNTVNDTNAVGVDVPTGLSVTLAGNFGVRYLMHLSTLSTDAKNLGFLINPRGGGWGGAVWTVPGITPGGKFLIPAGSGSSSDNTKGSVEGKYNPGAAFTAWAQFMPTGGSSFPVRFVAVPY